MNEPANQNARSKGGAENHESETPVLMGKAETPVLRVTPVEVERIRKGENSPLNSEKGLRQDFGKTNSDSNMKPKRKLNRRQALKVKRNRIRGRVNALRSELSQLEPALARLEDLLIKTNPELNRNQKGEQR